MIFQDKINVTRIAGQQAGQFMTDQPEPVEVVGALATGCSSSVARGDLSVEVPVRARSHSTT
jgi:hypothetical protein